MCQSLLSKVAFPCLVLFLFTESYGQTTVTITDVQDALLYNNTHFSQPQSRDVNYGGHIRISALAWTYSGAPSYYRGVIRFNLSSIPANATVQSAVLYFYSDPTKPSGADSNSGSNAFYLEKITEPWDEYTVTWNNQPGTIATDRVWVSPSVSSTENRQIAITNLVQQWVSSPSTNFGVMMVLENEVYYSSRNYASSNHSNTSIRPRLVVSYNSPPLAPTDLMISDPTRSSLYLSWADNSSNETGFQIERSASSGEGFNLIHSTSANVTSYIDHGLSSETEYFYRVRAVRGEMTSEYTEEASAVTSPHLISPTNGVGSPLSSVRLTWTDRSTDETGFQVLRSFTSGGEFELVGTTAANATEFVDTDLEAGRTYYYRIRAYDNGGTSAFSSEILVTTFVDGGQPLCQGIYCDTESGGVGIGTDNIPLGYLLAVKGKVMAQGVKVALLADWPDYVFSDGYALPDIKWLRDFIQANRRLPNIPSASMVERDGVDVGEINVRLLEKIEELSLYLIKMEERIRLLESDNAVDE